jgi:phage terminase large subunit
MFRSKARYLVCVAGRRFGKTIFALVWLVSEVCNRPPGALGYYVAPYRVMAKAIAWDKLLQLTRGWRKSYNLGELSVTLPGDRKICLKGADDPETLEGVGLSAVVLDEFARMKLDAWSKSIRPALSDNGGRALFCGKPRGHNHLKEFYERGLDRKQWPEWQSWLWTTLDGGNVAEADVQDAARSLPQKVYRQEYEATFETLAGRVYDGFTRRTHVVPHAELERLYKSGGRWNFRRVAIGVDFGWNHAGVAIVVGEVASDRWVVIHEEYHSELLMADDGWLRVYRALRDQFRPFSFFADPSQPANIQAMRKSLDGRPVVVGADNRIAEGVRKVSIALLNGRDGKPNLIFSDRCVNTIREMENYVYAEQRGVVIDTPVKEGDDCMDSLRYACAGLMT